MTGRYEIAGRYTLGQLFEHLESHPELAYSFIRKAKGGLEKITNVRLRKVFEENEKILLYDFDSPIMKIGLRQE
jgi:hypothetical protein